MIRYNSVHMYKVLNFTGNLPNDKDPLKILSKFLFEKNICHKKSFHWKTCRDFVKLRFHVRAITGEVFRIITLPIGVLVY